MYCLCIVEVFFFFGRYHLIFVFGLFYARRLGVAACDVHKESYDDSRKDEVLADASSPPDVVADKV